jgi:hypothetical protein
MSYSQLDQIGTDKLTRNSIEGFYNQNSINNSRIIWIGDRLSPYVSAACVFFAVANLFLRWLLVFKFLVN